MKRLQQTYHIKAPAKRVWEALVDPEAIGAWGGGPAKMEARVGARFELWGGDIHGTNTGVEKGKALAQDWYSGDWNQPSQVSFRLEAETGGTKVVLVHRNIPDGDLADIRDGWKEYYLGPMKAWLEN